MIRDRLRNKEYFTQRYIKDSNRLEKAILLFKTKKSEENNEDDLTVLHSNIINKALLKFNTEYSLGNNLNDFEDDIELIINHTSASWEGDVYEDIEKSLELAIIFDIRSNELNDLINLLKKYNYKDKFLDLLANHLNPEWEIRSDKLQFKKAVGPLVDVVELAKTDKTKAVKRLKTYLEKQWFNMQKEGLITNRDHLKKDKYRGYWSIEAAALVKMLNLDDEELKECKYYPYDLAHYKRN